MTIPCHMLLPHCCSALFYAPFVTSNVSPTATTLFLVMSSGPQNSFRYIAGPCPLAHSSGLYVRLPLTLDAGESVVDGSGTVTASMRSSVSKVLDDFLLFSRPIGFLRRGIVSVPFPFLPVQPVFLSLYLLHSFHSLPPCLSLSLTRNPRPLLPLPCATGPCLLIAELPRSWHVQFPERK